MTDVDAPVKLTKRDVLGKGLNNLRREGLVPAVIHNHGAESIHVMASEMELTKIYHIAGKHHPLNLQIGSDSYLALIKDAHFNPVKHRLQHVVFQAINRDEKVEAEVPLHLAEGEIPAEKIGLQVIHQLDHVEVEALPGDLPDRIVVDITKLTELGDKIVVADLAVPAGVTIITDAEHPIATVVEPKEQVEPEPEVVEDEEGAEGEEDAEGSETGEGQEPEGSGAEAAGQRRIEQ